jgi:hypothetical protein
MDAKGKSGHAMGFLEFLDESELPVEQREAQMVTVPLEISFADTSK